MKKIGLLFDISYSMKEKINNIKDIDKANKKSDELIEMIKNYQKILMQTFFQNYLGLKFSFYIRFYLINKNAMKNLKI